MRFRIVLTLIMLAVFVPFCSKAQLSGGAEIANLTISPEKPGPNQTVKATLSSFVTDLGTSDIAWLLNGENVTSGKGMHTFSFKTGDLGKKTTLEVIMISAEGFPFSKSLSFYPAKVSLVYESLAYIPPFYKGRAYFPYLGSLKIVAVPSFTDENGQVIPPENLVFNWKEKNRLVAESSGVGKNIYVFKGVMPMRPTPVYVDVSTPDKRMSASAYIELTPTAPKVVLYENNSEYGIMFNKALSDPIELTKPEIRILAVPLFFDISGPNDYKLKYEWNLNGNVLNQNKSEIVLRNSGNENGSANLSLQVSNTAEIFQFANFSANINLIGKSNVLLR